MVVYNYDTIVEGQPLQSLYSRLLYVACNVSFRWTFSAGAVLVLMELYDIFKDFKREKSHILYWFKDIFIFENVIGGGIIESLSFGYLIGNLSGHILCKNQLWDRIWITAYLNISSLSS